MYTCGSGARDRQKVEIGGQDGCFSFRTCASWIIDWEVNCLLHGVDYVDW